MLRPLGFAWCSRFIELAKHGTLSAPLEGARRGAQLMTRIMPWDVYTCGVRYFPGRGRQLPAKAVIVIEASPP